jgi:hypothetical protein
LVPNCVNLAFYARINALDIVAYVDNWQQGCVGPC